MAPERVPALVLHALGQPPLLESVEVADPGPGEVRVRVAAAGICHTDLGYMQYARATPVVLGHEGAGWVESVGAGVVHVRPGDAVAINWQPKCGRCKNCLRGRRDLCEDVQGTAAPRVTLNGKPLHVMLSAGVFCPLAVVPADGAVPIDPALPMEHAALLGCAVATGVGAALYTARVQPGDDVVVIGAGGVGLNIVQGARLALAGRIVAVDVDAGRLALARQVGATDTIDSRTRDPVAEVHALTNGRGADHVFEAVGLPALMEQGIAMLARRHADVGGRRGPRGGAGIQAARLHEPAADHPRLHLWQRAAGRRPAALRALGARRAAGPGLAPYPYRGARRPACALRAGRAARGHPHRGALWACAMIQGASVAKPETWQPQ